MRYVSNADRASAVAALVEWLYVQGDLQNWMKHLTDDEH